MKTIHILWTAETKATALRLADVLMSTNRHSDVEARFDYVKVYKRGEYVPIRELYTYNDDVTFIAIVPALKGVMSKELSMQFDAVNKLNGICPLTICNSEAISTWLYTMETQGISLKTIDSVHGPNVYSDSENLLYKEILPQSHRTYLNYARYELCREHKILSFQKLVQSFLFKYDSSADDSEELVVDSKLGEFLSKKPVSEIFKQSSPPTLIFKQRKSLEL